MKMKDMKKFAIFAGIAAALVASAPAQAAAEKFIESEAFAALDTDGDGYLSLQEAEKSELVKANFKDFDADQNGKLDLNEFTALINAKGDADKVSAK